MRLRPSLALGVGRDLVLAILACAVALLVLLSLQLGSTERDLRQRSLDQAAQYLDAHLVAGPDDTLWLPVPPGSSWSSFGYPAIVFDAKGRLLYKRPQSLDPATVEALAQRRLAALREPHPLGWIRFFTAGLGEQNLTVAALRTGSGAKERLIIVFKDENAPDVLVDDVVREFPYRSLRVMLPIFALLLLSGALIIRRRTRPLARVSAIAATIGPHTLNLRLPESELPTEVLPIVRGVNAALARLEQAAAAQRDFLRRAAHHLRTPLTVLAARAATLGDGEAAVQLRGDVAEIARIVAQLLQLNELDALPDDAAARADLGAVGEAVAGEFAARAAARFQHIALVRPAEAVLVRGDPNVIEIAVRNLVENALQHSPEGAAVTLRIDADGGLAVVDAGPGIAVALREPIFEPFWSGVSEVGRAGLGLTIVRRIAERYGAALTIDGAPGGGAAVTLRCVPAEGRHNLDPAALAATLPAGLARRRRRAALDPALG